MSDAEVIDAAFEVLQKQYPGLAQRPIAIQRSHWGRDPFARGATPHIPSGATANDLRLMGEPVGGRRGPLFFAGDATIDVFFGFVLGAHLLVASGVWQRPWERLPPAAIGFGLAACLTAAMILAPEQGQTFIYFTF